MKAILLPAVMLFCVFEAQAQRGVVRIPVGAAISIPAAATLCADTIFANNSGFGTLTFPNSAAICQAVVIPVELTAFSVAMHSGATVLQWTTAAEQHCAGYDVQRALPGGDWQRLGFVAAHGTPQGASSYTFEDPVPAELQNPAILHYRLRIVDHDGSFSYSPVVDARREAWPATAELHAVFPNPASDRLRISYSLASGTQVRLAMYTMAGEEVRSLRREASAPAGTHLVTENIEALPSGTYVIELVAHGVRMTQRFHVQR